MKEENTKKNLKISLSTFFLVIAIIVIIVMGYYLYITIEGKRDEEKQVSDLENEINILENTVKTLQQQVSEKSNTSNTVNTNSMQTNNSTTNEEKQFSNEEIKKVLQEYLNLAGVREGGSSALLLRLNLCTNSDIANEVIRDDGYVKTNIQYDDYKNAMLNYVTEDWFENRFSGGFKNENGILCYNAGGGTGIEFEVESINIKGEYSDSAYIGNVYNIALDGSKTMENIEFHIANENGKCVISYCD